MIYVDSLPTRETLDKTYDQAFFKIGSKYADCNGKASSANVHKRLDYIRNLKGPQMDAWLDIVCATGDFLLGIEGPATTRYGIDISNYAIEVAKQRGLDSVYAGDFLDVQLPELEGSFDIITMWDFIEHIANPRLTLEKARGFLKPNGYLILSTGDVGALSARLMGKYWHLMIPPRHLYYFSSRTMTRYLREAGFVDIRLGYPGKLVPLDFICYKAVSLIHPGAAARMANRLTGTRIGKMALPVNLLDIMKVSARRPSRSNRADA